MRYLFEDILENKISIEAPSDEILNEASFNWDHVSKPINGLGKFEKIHSRICAIQNTCHPDTEHMKLLVFCADHGIVEEGISQTDQSVTRICAENIGKGLTSVGVMASQAGVDIEAIDVGINYSLEIPYVTNKKIKNGTENFLKESAMSVTEFVSAVQIGMDKVLEAVNDGYKIILMGEMGIGNTTSAAVMAGYLLNLDAEAVTGRGAGLDDDRFSKKRAVVSMSLGKYSNLSPLEVCTCFGGLELAALTGVVIGGALYNVPIVLDGMLSMISALVADRIADKSRYYLIPSHKSLEPVTVKLARKLEVDPVLDGDMALGEGTGAVMMASLIKMTDKVYKDALKFGASGVEQYKRYK
ncbi:MAG: nicotinate-nucleotide--dimethylbenzimidazole phosphoribosyltransferase [Butyrivibrio sp.]|nr:nicotinate-nucleotide--dimethylbenzimidazole phosphoribosyltransferase [Butyrivibrio sp.]